MLLREDFETLWEDATSEEAFQKLAIDLKLYIAEHWNEKPGSIEDLLLSLLRRSGAAAVIAILKATLALSPLVLANADLIKRILTYLQHPTAAVRLASIDVVGRMASESSDMPGTFQSHLIKTLECERDVQCRDRLFVKAEMAIQAAQTKLAKLCLRETADEEHGPWREMLTLSCLQDADVRWRDWASFLDKLLPSMEEWDNLAWMGFCSLAEGANRRSSLYREIVERIPELMRIALRVEEKNESYTNRRARYVLTELIGPMGRRRKKKMLNENVAFFVNAMEYDDPGINLHCLELFAELSTVPLLSSQERGRLLNHDDETVRVLAAEVFVPD